MAAEEGVEQVRAGRERSLAERAMVAHGLRLSPLGLLGHRVERLRGRNYKSAFRLRSRLRRDLSLHMYRGEDVTVPRSAEGLRTFAGRSSIPALRSQALWMGALAASGLAVPGPVPGPDGSPLSVVPDGRGVRRCLFARWVPGRTLWTAQESIPDVRLLRLAGSFVAATHRASEGLSIPEGFLRPEWGYAHVFGPSSPLWERGGAVFSAGEMEVFRGAAERVHVEISSLGNGRDAFGVIHADLHVYNLIVGRDASGREAVGAVDFDRSGWGHHLYDLAVTLWSFERRLRLRPDDLRRARDAFLGAYLNERPLPPGHLRRLGVFEALRLCEVVARVLSWKETDRRAWGPSLLARAPKKLAELLEGAG